MRHIKVLEIFMAARVTEESGLGEILVCTIMRVGSGNWMITLMLIEETRGVKFMIGMGSECDYHIVDSAV